MAIQPTQPPAEVLVFLNQVSPRIGTANAVGLLKDVNIAAIFNLLKDLGVTQETIEKAVQDQMQKTAQEIVKTTPVPSFVQRVI